MEPILQTKKLDLRYGAFQALYGIDTDIFPNEITALIGPSGCGKSTYLKTLNRMNDLVAGCKIDGAVLFHGHNVYGDKIDVTGISKGHGYQGVVKRHGAGRTPMTHGGGPVHRHAGSMGASSHQSRIFPGKIGAGQMGNEQVTIENLDVVKVDAELNMIVIRGAIPGPKGGLVYIRNTVKNNKVKNVELGISKNPQKASGRNPQKASARG